MRFLIDANLPRAPAALLIHYGHEAEDVRDVGLGGAEDPVIAFHARQQGLCLVTGDLGFADVRNYHPARYPGLVVLRFLEHAPSRLKLQLLEEFLQQRHLVDSIVGKLAIVEPGRIRVRTG